MKHIQAALLGLFLLFSLPLLNGKTTTFDTVLQKSEELLNVDPQTVLETAQKHLTSLGERAPAKERLEASLLVGRALINLGRFPEALKWGERASSLASQSGETSKGFDALRIMMSAWSSQGNDSIVEKKALEAIGLATKLNLKPQIVSMANALGTAYMGAGKVEEALEVYLKAYRIAEEIHDSTQLCHTLLNLTGATVFMMNYPKALEYNDAGIALAKRIGSLRILVNQYITRGTIMENLGRPREVVNALNEAVQISRRIGYTRALLMTLNNLADTYLNLQEYDKVIVYAQEAEALALENNNPADGAVIRVTYAQALGKLGRPREAIPLIRQSLAFFLEKGKVIETMQVRGFLAEAYEQAGLYKEALESHKLFKAESDRLRAEERSRRIAELQTRYEADKREREIALLNKDNALKSAELKRKRAQQSILLTASLSFVLIAFLLYRRNCTSKATNRKLTDLNERLHSLSLTDNLTGLHNRRYIDSRIDQDIAQALRTFQGNPEKTLSFLIVDIDNFKRINDTEGHHGGDLVLQEFSRRLKEALRESDILVRWGGEEFLVVAPDSSVEGARELALRIVETVRSRPFLLEERELFLTCSVGYCGFPFSSENATDLGWNEVVQFADGALYEAKRAGKNRAVGLLPGPSPLNREGVRRVLQDPGKAEQQGLVLLARS